jgi:uncharacterized protein (TIGR02145 family)
MKKISLLATLSVAAMFAACGDNGSSADNDDVTYSSSAENIDTVSSSSADNAGGASSGNSDGISSGSNDGVSSGNEPTNLSSGANPTSSSAETFSSESSDNISSSGTSAPQEPTGSFTDSRDGKSYKLVKIGDQTWMAENLHFADSLIYIFSDAQKVCPENFHLPSLEEIQELVDHVGGLDIAAKVLKSTSGWPSGEFGDWNGTDDFGFNAMPVDSGDGGTDENFWTSTHDYHNYSTGMMLKINPYPISKYRCGSSADNACLLNAEPDTKLSVRCLSNISSCGTTTYNNRTHFCQNSTVYSLCRGRSYDAGTYVCKDQQLYSIATDSIYKYSWVWLNPEKEYGIYQDPRDKQYYKTIVIDTLVWMAENLNYASEGSVCFENDSMYCDLYGRMYTITQARNGKEPTDYDEDVQGICPDGWRLPKESEFKAAIGGNDPHVTVYAKIIGYDTNKEMYEHQNKTGLSIVFGGIHNSEPSIYWPEWDGLNIEGGIIGSNFEFDVYYHYYQGSNWGGYIRDGQAENVRCVKRL